MTRTFQDHDLQLWEAYANPGEQGSAERAHLLFHCLSDPGRRARVLRLEAPRSNVEQELVAADDGRLVELLGRAEEVK
jgi:hypothetical protein